MCVFIFLGHTSAHSDWWCCDVSSESRRLCSPASCSHKSESIKGWFNHHLRMCRVPMEVYLPKWWWWWLPNVAESQQASIHRAVCKVLHAAMLLRDVFSSSQGIMALPDGFSFVHLAFIWSLIICRWLLYLGREGCWIGLWHFSWVRSIDYDLLFIFYQQFYCIGDKPQAFFL